MKRVFWVIPILTALCFTPSSETLEASSSANRTAYKETLDQVWETLSEHYFDPTFGGMSWEQLRDRYRDRIIGAESDSIFYVALNEMLFELGVSHLGVVPANDVKQLGEAMIFAEATVGMDVRFIDDAIRVIRVQDGSSAQLAGIRPGDRVDAINGKTIAEISADRLAFPAPPFTQRHERYMVLDNVYWELFGRPGEEVVVVIENSVGETRTVKMLRQSRGAQSVFEPVLPPTYVQFAARRIGDDIGYISFSSFHPEILDDLIVAIDTLSDTRGLIIDLRGNPGGAFPVRYRLASKFVSTRTPIWLYRGRDQTDEIVLEPTSNPYDGELVILVDGMSASSSEEFAGGLQAMGRATVIGERTVGKAVVQDVIQLPVGAYFVFPIAETRTVNGNVLEYRGVIPDIKVAYTRANLRSGEDAQLTEAIRHLSTR